MTLAVGLVDKGQVCIGADSAEAGIYNLTVRADPPIVCKGPFLFGFPGSFRMENLVRYRLDLPDYDPKTDLREFIVTQVAARIREWIHKGELVPQIRAKMKGASAPAFRELEGLLLVGYPCHLFTIGFDGQVVEAFDGYDALGTGDEMALGAFRATRREAPQQRVCSALHAAEHLTGAVRPPFHVWSLDQDGTCTKCEYCPGTHLREHDHR